MRASVLAVPAAVVLIGDAARPATADDPPPVVDVPAPVAPDDTRDPYTTIVVGLRLPRPLRDVPATVTVLGRKELARSPRRSVDELLRAAPSAATFRRSASLTADPTSQGVNLRGLGPSGVSRALVLRDGVPLNDPFGGWVYWRAVPATALERIEITPGGASAVFGNFALGGVVQLVSRPIEGRAVDVVVSSGSWRTHRGAARVTERVGAVGLEVDGEVLDSAGFAPIAPEQRGEVDGPAATRHASAGARVEWTRGAARLRAHGWWFDEHLDAGTRFTTADVRTVTAGVAGAVGTRAGIVEGAAFAGDQELGQDRARVDATRDAAALATRQRVPSSSQGASVVWTVRPVGAGGRHQLVVGADALRVAGTSSETLFPAQMTPASTVARRAGGEQRLLGVFVQDLVRVTPALDVHAAVRIDGWQDVGGARTVVRGDGEQATTTFPARRAVQLDPRVGVLRRVGDAVAVRASAYRAFRAPTLNELYRPFQVGTVITEANPALRAETTWGAEAGAEVVAGTMIARGTTYWSAVRDPIQNVTLAEPLAGGATRQRQNLGRARVRGVELDLSWRPSARWLAIVAYTFADAVVVTAPAQPELVGRRLAQAPRHRASGTVTFDDPRWVVLTVHGRFLDRQYEDDLNTRPLDACLVLDAMVERRLGRGLFVFATVENALDQRYLVGRAGVDTIGAPRALHVGLRLAHAR